MIRKSIVTFIFIFCAAASFAKLVSKAPNGIMTVKTEFYSIQFFPKFMFPYQIEIAGKKIKPVFLDRLYMRKSKRLYFLNKDRFAELKLISDNGIDAVIQTQGTYCFNNSIAAQGTVKAVYTYRFNKKSPVVDISAVVTKSDNTEWSELRFLQPGFKSSLFSTLANYKSNLPVDLNKRTKNTMFSSPQWSVFSDGKVALGVGGRHTLAWYDFKRQYYSYLCRSVVKNWKSSKVVFSGKLYLGPAKNREQYNKLLVLRSKNELMFSLEASPYKVIIGPKNSTIRKIFFEGAELGASNGWYGTIFAAEKHRFIGAGHTEGGEENVINAEVSVDGVKQNIVAGKSYSGKKVIFKKVSMLANIKVHMILTVASDEINIRKEFEALEDQKAYSMYIFQFCWTNKMTDWVACLGDNKIETGDFGGKTGKFLLNKPKVKYLVEYSRPLKKGIIMYFDQVYSCRNNTFWNRRIYKKFYMMLKVPKVYCKGFKSPSYKIRLKGFSSSPDNLRSKVEQITAKMGI